MRTKIKELDFYKELSEVFECYREQEMAVFLDSSLNGSLGRYSVIGLQPYLVVKEIDGITYETRMIRKRDRKKTVEDFIKTETILEDFIKAEMVLEDSFESAVKKHCLNYYEENSTGLPLVAGAIGYLSYDYGRKFEQIETRHPKKIQVPEALFAFYDILIIEDKKEKKLYLTARGELEDARIEIELLEKEIKESCNRAEKKNRNQEALKIHEKEMRECRECFKEFGISEQKSSVPVQYEKKKSFAANFEKDDYMRTVERMVSYIVEGDIYIANMTQQLRMESSTNPYEVYRYLRTHNPSPFGGYFNYGGFQILCASPERFLRIKDGRIETRPIKGTRKRGRSADEDQRLAQELRDSEKEQSELLMIVDLERNDLSRVCVPGSVKVPELFAIETYATVFHMVSTVTGTLKENVHAMDVIEAVFPGGSITGAPKIRAMEIIDELEHDRRGIYTGCIGYIAFDGSCDLNIVIRTALYQNGTYYLGVGGGITCESESEFEYEETLQKAKAVLEAITENKK